MTIRKHTDFPPAEDPDSPDPVSQGPSGSSASNTGAAGGVRSHGSNDGTQPRQKEPTQYMTGKHATHWPTDTISSGPSSSSSPYPFPISPLLLLGLKRARHDSGPTPRPRLAAEPYPGPLSGHYGAGSQGPSRTIPFPGSSVLPHSRDPKGKMVSCPSGRQPTNQRRPVRPSPTSPPAHFNRFPPVAYPSTRPDLRGHVEPNKTRRTGYFHGARDFVVKDSTMIENVNVQRHVDDTVLQWLSTRIIPGAIYDSYARDPPPRCHPGTRSTTLDFIQEWLGSVSTEKKKLLWLHGPAGVGKSAIMHTLAEMESESGRLGATFFFSRSEKQNDLQAVLPTIAYGLVVKILPYRTYIQDRRNSDPTFLDKGLKDQFRTLITEPFTQQSISGNRPKTWTILIDGLDECQSPEDQCKIIEVLSTFVSKHPAAPFIWVVASRTESHLQALFERPNIQLAHLQQEILIDSEEGRRDVQHYLDHSFSEIRQKFPNHLPTDTKWPTKQQLDQITGIAGGYFLFASTAIRFIESTDFDDPVSQLIRMLAVTEGSSSSFGKHPFTLLDIIYTEVLSLVPDDVLPTTKRILGYLLLPNFGSLRLLCNLLGLGQHEAYSAVRRLHSVLKIPPLMSADTMPISFLHGSFSDYLKTPARSHRFCVDVEKACREMWNHCFRIVLQADVIMPTDPLWHGAFSITRSWGYQNADLDKELAVELWVEARWRWMHLLLPDCDCDNPTSSQPRLLLTVSERIQVFTQINFGQLICEPVRDNSFHYFSLCSWLLKHWHVAPEEFQTAGFVQKTTLYELDLQKIVVTNRKMVFHTASNNLGYHYEYGSANDPEGLAKILDKVRTHKERTPSTTAFVFANTSSEGCVIFEFDRLGGTTSPQGGCKGTTKELFFLPYLC